MTHIPILRAGRPYTSLNTVSIAHVASGEDVATVSHANAGLIAKDLAAADQNRRALSAFSVSSLVSICARAATFFMESGLPLDDETQSPQDYVRQLSGTAGLPESLCRNNMEKIRSVLDGMETVLGGLTRGLDLSVLDAGWGLQAGRSLSYACQTESLGAVLPSNSPGVHSLWLPAIPLKVPVVLKPGSGEPWTPYRVAQAFLAAGCPPEAFGFYPTDYAGGVEILLRCGRSMLFGGDDTVRPWAAQARIQIHGTGRSKVIVAEDQIDGWTAHMDLLVDSVVDNGGRSCTNTSGVWVPAHGREIAEALAKRLAAIEAKPLPDPSAQLAAFANPKLAWRTADLIDTQLKTPGATDLTAHYRPGPRVVERDGCTFLLPTVIWCEDPSHPLANVELLFPFVSVVEVAQRELIERIGPTLVVSAITEDERFVSELLRAPHIDRLNLGPIPTHHVAWDQPHEGNLFEHLYRQRALQRRAS